MLGQGADLVAFGRLFIANPDLPRRLGEGAPFNAPDQSTLYGGTQAGYTDYPALAAAWTTFNAPARRPATARKVNG